ncbi:hypothetical protein [Halobellus rubicundus]|uniref:DUF4013 domain-containing protein n=1 Tax=Halobellus rubicundus TaxID=2996466 RepID=A0ABD5M683_9EURY
MVDSDWWVGVALPPLLEVVGLLALSLSDTVDGPPTALDVLPAAFVLLSLVLIPVFAIALYVDARAVARSAETWTPDPRLWGVAGVVAPAVGLALVDSPLLLFVGSAYLLRRFRPRDPSPAGIGPDAHEAVGEADDRGASAASGRSRERVSRWYYGVALTVAAFAVLAVAVPLLGAVLGVSANAEFVYETIPTVGVFLPLVVLLALVAALVLIPVFSVSLYLDVRAVRESAVGWTPDRRIWGVVAGVHLLNVLVPMTWLLSVPAGGYYLWLRHRRVGRP